MRHVEIEPLPLERLTGLLTPERAQRLMATAEAARRLLGDRVVWNVNATAQGGGVAEMLQTLLAYARGAGVDTRWLVLRGDPAFFAVTKRLHNVLHGEPGDGGPLGDAERRHYEAVLDDNLQAIVHEVRPGDIVLLHDPQTAGLVDGLLATGAHVVWRCHVGRDEPNEQTDRGWEFLRPYLAKAEAHIYSRRQYAPAWVDPDRLWVIPPSIDPFTAKNQDLTAEEVVGVLCTAGLARGGECPPLSFRRRDGRDDVLRRHHGILVDTSTPPPVDARLVVQVSRWDRLKDMAGVMAAFARHVGDLPDDVHLVLAGPEVGGVSDDPEGAEVLAECIAAWRALDPGRRERVHLATLPMDDVDENALMVNALQRHAHVVVQKSLVEGFGLTVAEAMWKGRPVVASAVGGIQDQIRDGQEGLLVHDPRDLDELAAALRRLLGDPELAHRLGEAGRERVRDQLLGDRHLIQYVELCGALLD
ncbi:MAG: glycosyltransferase [Actinomycetes bacterium]